ncbi:hypothetical protein QR680_004608 [Steinernema hermaphroditum]|uniref:Fibronectin type-III domain-containing protein n=1 Tax=Steinernema hermaphroditum TaxID=289476 RepID=A0AA39HP87_9BILA|nr:hypothetical protein QR680_004608 [Steinernema hermaphroditum]
MSRIAATLALILTLLTGAAATVASKARDEATLARCLAGCAVRFVPNRTVERRLLSGETRTERDDANEQYHLCSLGCNMPVFAGPFSSVLVGRELYQQAKELPMEELPQILSRVDPVCVKAMDDSTTLLLALDLLDKHHASPYICRMDVWAKTLATSEPTIVHSEYTMKPHYSLKHKLQPQASYQFRVNCYSFDGKLGQQVQSEWFLSDQLVPSTTPLNIVLDREESVDGHVSSLLSWNKPSGSLPFCEQRMYLTSKQTQMRIVELDESRRINLSKLNFETDYLLKIVPEKGDPRETRGLKFTTGACHKLSNRSEFCLPHGVRSLHAFHDAPTDRLFIAWSYTEAESAEDISFLVTVRLGARVIHEEVVKRTDRTAFVNLDHRSGNYEIDVVVIDLKNRRSPPSVTKFVPPNNRGHWILTLLAVSIGLVIILLLVTSLAFGYYIRNRNREAPQTDETHLMEAGAEAASQETVEPTMYFSTPLNRIKVNAQPKSCFRNTNREVISEIGSSSSLPKLDLSTSLNGNEKYFRFPIIETPTASEDGFKVAHLPDGRRVTVPRIGTYI